MISSICIEITRKCHLKCKHCSTRANNRIKDQINFDDFKNLLNKLELEKNSIIFLSGGEPLLHVDLPLFIREINKKGYRAFLYSSGVLINNKLMSLEKKYMQYLINCGLSGISFSIYSLHNFHDYVTGVNGSLKFLKETLKNIADLEFRKEISFIPLKSNYKEIKEIILFAHQNKIQKVNILRLINQGRAKFGFFEKENLNKEEEKEFLNLLNSSLINNVTIEISKMYECNNDYELLKSPFTAGINEIFVTSNMNILKGRKFRDYENQEASYF